MDEQAIGDADICVLDANALAELRIPASEPLKIVRLADEIAGLLAREPGLRRLDLARRLGISMTDVHRAVKRLRGDGRLPGLDLGRAWSRR